MIKIEDYLSIVGEPTINDIRLLAEKLQGRKILHVNSTATGGGVAEILNRMNPLLQQLGVESSWQVIKGGERFYEVTKKFHNALHGKRTDITEEDFSVFLETGQKNTSEINTDADILFIHDPQPITLIDKKKDNRWIWRCHVDVSTPQEDVWQFLKQYVERYDAAVFSAPSFGQQLDVRQFLIAPSIDPLSDKNKELPQERIDEVVRQYGLSTTKPMITQISRFDRLKDPVGVIKVYQLVKKYIDCQLVLAGGGASDDPEGIEVFEEVKALAKNDPDIHILLLPQNDIVINALQRASTVIMQKSLKEGFGLTVSEALWKAKPVVASNVGGIPLQITHKYSGLLCHSVEGAAFAVKQLLHSPQYAKKLGEQGREHVRNNFLLTRHLKDYLLLFHALFHSEDVVYL